MGYWGPGLGMGRLGGGAMWAGAGPAHITRDNTRCSASAAIAGDTGACCSQHTSCIHHNQC